MTAIGAHLHDGDPLEQAQAIGADAVQFFLGDPQGWKAPAFPGDPADVRAGFESAGIEAYVHAPYVINVASPNNRIRIPSRKLLEQQLQAAASIGAKRPDRARRPCHGRSGPGGGLRQLAQGHRAHRPAAADADREHRRRRRGDGPRRSMRSRGSGTPSRARPMAAARSASAWIRATRSRPARTWPASWTGSGPSPAGSTWCTATTRGTSSAPAATATPAWSQARSTRPCSSRSSAPPGQQPSARRRDAADDVRWLRAKLS